jgi:hypothetical protein
VNDKPISIPSSLFLELIDQASMVPGGLISPAVTKARGILRQWGWLNMLKAIRDRRQTLADLRRTFGRDTRSFLRRARLAAPSLSIDQIRLEMELYDRARKPGRTFDQGSGHAPLPGLPGEPHATGEWPDADEDELSQA